MANYSQKSLFPLAIHQNRRGLLPRPRTLLEELTDSLDGFRAGGASRQEDDGGERRE